MALLLEEARAVTAGAVDAFAFALEVAAALIIAAAAALALVKGARAAVTGSRDEERVRVRFVRSLVFSLEVFVAADLLRTIVAPSLAALATVAAIIVIRTILALALEFELRGSSVEGA